MFEVNTGSNKKTSKKNKNISIIVAIVLFLIISIIIFYFFQGKKTSYSNYIIDKSKDLVFTYREINTGRFYKQIPHINLSFNGLNEDIDLFVSDYLNNDDNIINYKYNISNNILSLIIRIISFNSEKAPINYFKSYNIDLNHVKVIDDKELLNYFKISNELVLEKIQGQFKDYYYDLVVKGKIDEEKCNLDCFIGRRGFMGYMQDLSYYVDNGKLVIYKPFIINSSVWEYEYFKDEDFSFNIN